MSNTPFHVAYRPKKLKDFLGNSATKKCIEAMLESPNCPRAYMLVGRSGCGKTTLARIIAKKVGCNRHSILEINAADDRGVETGRSILQMIKIKPLLGEARAIIIDECHRMTRDFQESLLKALEEPPENVYFILCTTDPQKVIETIKGQRCSQFELKPLKDEEIKQILNDVLRKNSREMPSEIIDYLIEISEGVPRKALVALNKVVHFKDEDRNLKTIKKLLAPQEDHNQAIDLCRALISGKEWGTIQGILKSLLIDAKLDNFEQIRQAVLGYVSSVALNSATPNRRAMLIYECFKEPFYTAGKAHLVFACLYVMRAK